MAVEQSPPIEREEKPVTLASLAALNEHDRVIRTLDRLLANGELADYDDELANDVKRAKEIVRGVCWIAEVDAEKSRLLELIQGRDKFIVGKGLWNDFVDQLPK